MALIFLQSSQAFGMWSDESKPSTTTRALSNAQNISLRAEFENVDISHKTITSFLKHKEATYEKLMNSSTGKDIVVFLGNTGSGKSTLINYLNEKPLICERPGRIKLGQIEDADAMQIGHGRGSQTFLPQFINKNGVLFYDFAGLNDTGGALVNILNASFIKNILEKAKSTKIVFVVSNSELDTGRGQPFKEFLEKIKRLIPENNNPALQIEDISGLVITKTNREELEKDELKSSLEELVKDKLEDEHSKEIRFWKEKNKIGQFRDGKRGTEVNHEDRGPLLELISKIEAREIKNVNTGALLPALNGQKLQEIFLAEGKEISEKVEEVPNLAKDIEALDQAKRFYEKHFEKESLSGLQASPLVSLLKPIAELQYSDAEQTYKKILEKQKKKNIKKINEKIKDHNQKEDNKKRTEDLDRLHRKINNQANKINTLENTITTLEKSPPRKRPRSPSPAKKPEEPKAPEPQPLHLLPQPQTSTVCEVTSTILNIISRTPGCFGSPGCFGVGNGRRF